MTIVQSIGKPTPLNSQSLEVLRDLAATYGLDLFDQESEISLKLEQVGYHNLVLEKHEPHVFSLAQTYIQEGDVMSVPFIRFIAIDEQTVYPFSIDDHSYEPFYYETAKLHSKRHTIATYDIELMRELVEYCDNWLKEIKNQLWYLSDCRQNPRVKDNLGDEE